MKFENAAIVMTDSDTGKPYARPLSAWELNLVLSQLQALDGGALKAREIAPFVLHSVGVSPQQAQRIAEKQAGLQQAARQGVQAFEDMAHAHRVAGLLEADAPRTVKGTGKIPGGVQQIAKPQPKIKPVEAEVLEAARQPWQKHCPHNEHYHGRCQVCGHKVKP